MIIEVSLQSIPLPGILFYQSLDTNKLIIFHEVRLWISIFYTLAADPTNHSLDLWGIIRVGATKGREKSTLTTSAHSYLGYPPFQIRLTSFKYHKMGAEARVELAITWL